MTPQQTSDYMRGLEDGRDYANTWITTPPEDYGEYLITFTALLGDRRSKNLVDLAEYDGTWLTHHLRSLGYGDIEVLAWQPLPEPWKGESTKIEEAKAVLLNAAWLGTDKDRERVEEAVRVLVNQPNIELIRAEIAEDLEKYSDILDDACMGLQMALDIIRKHEEAANEN